MIPFDLQNHYWRIATNPTQFWSSDRRMYVDANDQTYVAWLAAGGAVTNIATEAELCDVLNRPVILQIAALEMKQARPLREIALQIATPEGQLTPAQRLAELDTEIAALRASLLA